LSPSAKDFCIGFLGYVFGLLPVLNPEIYIAIQRFPRLAANLLYELFIILLIGLGLFTPGHNPFPLLSRPDLLSLIINALDAQNVT
jgi:hypothetical protein